MNNNSSNNNKDGPSNNNKDDPSNSNSNDPFNGILAMINSLQNIIFSSFRNNNNNSSSPNSSSSNNNNSSSNNNNNNNEQKSTYVAKIEQLQKKIDEEKVKLPEFPQARILLGMYLQLAQLMDQYPLGKGEEMELIWSKDMQNLALAIHNFETVLKSQNDPALVSQFSILLKRHCPLILDARNKFYLYNLFISKMIEMVDSDHNNENDDDEEEEEDEDDDEEDEEEGDDDDDETKRDLQPPNKSSR